jgi:hypothetical protein
VAAADVPPGLTCNCAGGVNGTDGPPVIPEILMIVCPEGKKANQSYLRMVK